MSGESGPARGLLCRGGVAAIYHYAPLHYLPFIARRAALLSKEKLRRAGFSENHFRSTSKRQDISRGFDRYVHLTLDAHPPILQAKLAKGFPHFEIGIPAQAVEQRDYLLCRFNIAKTRYFRGARQAPEESAQNGKYYGDFCLPVARTEMERGDLFAANYGRRMIEVLVEDEIPLSASTLLRFFHPDDVIVARDIATRLRVPYTIELDAGLGYVPRTAYRTAVMEALATAMQDDRWLGNGLEFDRV